MNRWILGINAYHGDVSAALLCDGNLVAAAEEERFTRVRHAAGFPGQAIQACLDTAGITGSEIERIAISRRPRAHLWRKVCFTLRHRPGLKLIRSRLNNAEMVREISTQLAPLLHLSEARVKERIEAVEHHPAHLASAFLVSPFEDASVCALDAFGDFVSTTTAAGRGNRVQVLDQTYFPHSLGMLYLALTQFLGFSDYGEEYKVMGLASFGEPEMADSIRRLIFLQPRGRFRLNLKYFRHWNRNVFHPEGDRPQVDRVYSDNLMELLGPARERDDPVTDRHRALAASLQEVFEEAALHVLTELYERTRNPRLCLAGGCAMNAVLNGRIRRNTPFREIFVQPAAADNGTALGAAFHCWHASLGQPRGFVMDHAYWGPGFDESQLRRVLSGNGSTLERAGCSLRHWPDREALCRWTAAALAEGRVVGWFQGRMEWGARALGNRSILADPRRPEMRDILNKKIKLREEFRPFAPSVLEESVDSFFEDALPDRFMTQVYPVRPSKRTVIPAVTHVDGTGRLQAVQRESNPLFWGLLKAFEGVTGVPVLLNTSFNESEPIVHRPEEALDCFTRTQMDVLVIGPYTVCKNRGGEVG